jgi:hypothetical protein
MAKPLCFQTLSDNAETNQKTSQLEKTVNMQSMAGKL